MLAEFYYVRNGWYQAPRSTAAAETSIKYEANDQRSKKIELYSGDLVRNETQQVNPLIFACA